MVFQVHVAEFSTISAGGGVCEGHLEAQYTRSVCDVLLVQSGGASELYSLMVKQIQSVGGPEITMNPLTLRSAACGFDQAQTCKAIPTQAKPKCQMQLPNAAVTNNNGLEDRHGWIVFDRGRQGFLPGSSRWTMARTTSSPPRPSRRLFRCLAFDCLSDMF
jgi:hypothetical protein